LPSSSNNVTRNPELEKLIKDVKVRIRKYYGGVKEQIERTGNFLKEKKLVREKDICVEIKCYLKEEIEEKIISSDTIERFCPDDWKRKTKPKVSGDPQLRIYEDKNPQEQETVTEANTNVTPEGQVLQYEFGPPDDSIIGEQRSEVRTLDLSEQQGADINREQESEKSEKLNEEGQEGDIWTDSAVLRFAGFELVVMITVNSNQKKIERLELDIEKYFTNNI
jgi:hypothetical protein